MLLDNKRSGYVGNELKKRSFEESKLSVLSSLFTLYGFASLKKELSKLQAIRLFLTDWQSELGLKSIIGNEQELRLINQLDQKRIAVECAKWLKGNVHVKAFHLRWLMWAVADRQSAPSLSGILQTNGATTRVLSPI